MGHIHTSLTFLFEFKSILGFGHKGGRKKAAFYVKKVSRKKLSR